MRALIIAIFAVIFGFIGGIILAIALSGTNVVLPGLGLVISGALIGFIIGVFFGAILGFIVGYIVSRRII
ncbi:MAG: hypothetical protein M3209_19450 [Acidobacteriota bacterium]|nr:hypothetical protein [Acidobacteriota bacterium]